MRFSSAVVLAVVAALASSTSARPTDAVDASTCSFCTENASCKTCGLTYCNFFYFCSYEPLELTCELLVISSESWLMCRQKSIGEVSVIFGRFIRSEKCIRDSEDWKEKDVSTKKKYRGYSTVNMDVDMDMRTSEPRLHRLRNWWVSCLGVEGKEKGEMGALSSEVELENEKEWNWLPKIESRDCGTGASNYTCLIRYRLGHARQRMVQKHSKARHFLLTLQSYLIPSHTMRFTFAIILAAATAFAPLISATPVDASIQKCDFFCMHNSQCNSCPGAQICNWFWLCEENIGGVDFDWEILDMTCKDTNGSPIEERGDQSTT
ncbi:hypothetical protein BD769DRAFT_1383977 [Suillus cothurnatus]|nr:hypothetical protein BD769DRAFT_1383977 [Suillus cothurnatus]